MDTVYTFNVNCIARGELDSPAATDPATGMKYYLYTAPENGKKVFSTSSKPQKDYWMFIPETVTTLTLNAQAAAEGDTVTYNGSTETTVDVSGTDKIDVRTVHGEKSDYTWTIHLVKQEVATVRFDVPAGANVRVWDSDNVTYNPQADGLTYAGLTKSASYNYVVVKDGFVSVTGTFVPGELTDGKVSVTMEAVPASTHKNYSGEWTNFRGSDDNMAIRSAQTPTTTNEVHLKWAVKMGTGMWASPTPPIILNDVEVDGKTRDVLICAMSRKIYLLDKETGETLKSADMAGSAGFATNPLTYGDGMVFVQVDNQIQAFDAATLESVWLSEKIGGQSISPITYYKGYIYIGFWNGESYDGKFACFSVDDEKPGETNETKYAKWTLTHKGGFYWAGAYVTDNYVVFGSDDGSSEGDYTASATLYSVNPDTGAIIDRIDGVKGDIRSTVAYYNGACYAVTKGGLFLKAPIDSTGHFDHAGFKTVEMGNMCTSTPIIYNGKAFIGTSGAQQFGSPGTLNVIDVNTMQIVKNVTLPGYPQAPMLMSTGYEEETGKVMIYTTYNAPPGGLYCVTWDTKKDEYEVEHIFVPESSMQQYCLGSPICDSEGTIYYKNDSGYLFALTKTDLYATDISVDGQTVSGFKPDSTSYTMTVRKDTAQVRAAGSAGSTVEITCGEQKAADALTVNVPEGDTTVQITVRKGENERVYTLTLHRASSATGLVKLFVNNNDTSTEEVYVPTPVYSDDVTEYFLYDLPSSVTRLYLHAIAAQAGMRSAYRYVITPEKYYKAGKALNGSKIGDTHFSFRQDFDLDPVTNITDISILSEDGNTERRFRFTATHLSEEEYKKQGKIMGFSVNGNYATIDEAAKTIRLDLVIPSNEIAEWDLKSLTPDIIIAGASVSPASGVTQDFTNPVKYTVTASDGTTSEYTVTATLTAGPSSDTGIKSLSIGGYQAVKQAELAYDNWGNAYVTYLVTLPYGVEIPEDDDAMEIVTEAEGATVWGSYHDGQWSIRVTAPNGARKDYWVFFKTQDTPNTITFDANGGTCETASMQVSEGGVLAELPEAAKNGAVFAGWYTEQTGGDVVTTETVFVADTTVYAHWVVDTTPIPVVEEKINAIGDVTLESEDAIKAAREAYDALTDEQKALVSNYDVLVAAEARYAQLVDEAAAEHVIDLINGIGKVNKNSGTAIKAARDAYDALTPAQKKLVSNYQTLLDAEKRYEELTTPVNPVGPSKPSKPSASDTDQKLPFTDVAKSDWYYDGVKYAYENGLMNGTGANAFNPGADTTRGMIVTILARLEGVNTTGGAAWYEAGREWAMQNGISDGTNMDGKITREQLAAMLYRYAKMKGYDVSASASLSGYTDASGVSGWAKEAMQWAVGSGLIQGSGNALTPQANASRAQIATILMRFAEKIAK